jgi:hypothetical protein
LKIFLFLANTLVNVLHPLYKGHGDLADTAILLTFPDDDARLMMMFDALGLSDT